MVVAEVELTDQEAERLKELAADKHITVPELIHDAIEHRLHHATELTMAEKRRRALEVVGKYHSGLGDLAENHDKYLAEAFGS